MNVFSGNIFIFHSFDIGDDINLERVNTEHLATRQTSAPSKYFKNYHIPLEIELPSPTQSPQCISAKLHNFGVITLRYKIPFKATLEELRSQITVMGEAYQEQSINDAQTIFKRIKTAVKQPKFFHLRRSYVLIQVDPESTTDVVQLKNEYGSVIASTLRFETESLSEPQKNEILESAVGYYRGDLIIIDTDAAFVYDAEYEEILDLFEFANMQQLELQYFDRMLDKKLNTVYEREVKTLPLSAYLPFIDIGLNDQVGDLSRLRVDISVITERLENSVKLAGEPYYAELYSILVEKLDLKNWKESIDNKLTIISDISAVYQDKVDAIRSDLLSVAVIVLVFIEAIVGILHLFKK